MDDPLEEIVGRLDQAKLLVLGDIALERVLRGEAVEAGPGVLRLRAPEQTTRVGAAGGIAAAAAAVGAQVWAAGILGQDPQSGEVLRALAGAGVDPFGMVTAAGARTGESMVVEFDAAGPWSRVEIELAPPPPLEGPPAQEMLQHIEPLIARADALVMVSPRAAAPETLARAAEFARGRGKLVIGALGDSPLPPGDVVVQGPADDAPAATPEALIAVRDDGSVQVLGGRVETASFAAALDRGDPRAWEQFIAGVAAAAAIGAEPLAAARIGAAAAAAGSRAPITADAIRRQLSAG
ncbi:MAG TPA: PfkB family carbohydrate kinase [Armatimonadota bacterium]|nr:PfkB family carbohydrate kinase [Armatimonadota bacterium]